MKSVTPFVEVVVVSVYVPKQVFFGTESEPKVALSDTPAGTGTVTFTKVSGFATQEGGPLKTTLTVMSCKLLVQFVSEGVTLKFWPGAKVVGLTVFSAYRQETE